MADANDMDLVRKFAGQNSEAAFAELVRRHINLVYSVALRFTGNTGSADGIGTANPYWLIDYPAGYHNGSGRFSFADGHVESHRWLEPTILVPLGQARAAHTSATDRDVQWLQNHCTYLK